MPELRHLSYFLAVAEELSITQAARRLRMAQPALSQAITKLERQVGARLFDRGHRQIRLTAAGQSLLPEARFLLARAREISETLTPLPDEERVLLRVGCIASAVSGLLPRLLPAFLRAHPHVVPVVREMGEQAQAGALRRHEIDVGVCRLLSGGEETLRVRFLGDERLYCAVPDGHRLAGRGAVALRELAGERLVGFPREMAPVAYDTIVGACVRAGFSPRFSQQAVNDQAILGVVACGLALALVPGSSTRIHMEGTSYLPLTDAFAVTPLSVVLRADGAPPAAHAFADAAADACRAER